MTVLYHAYVVYRGLGWRGDLHRNSNRRCRFTSQGAQSLLTKFTINSPDLM